VYLKITVLDDVPIVSRSYDEGGGPMKCPSCGEGKLVRDARDIPYSYKGETTTIPSVRGEFLRGLRGERSRRNGIETSQRGDAGVQ
jgi:YgiT-type zinc finger domain-containing protein